LDGKLKYLLLLLPVPLTYALLHHFLDSSGGWALLTLYAAVPLLTSIEAFFPKFRKICEASAVILILVQTILLVGELILLPYKAYELWFELLHSGLEQGRVSHLFVKLGSLLMGIICRITARRDSPLLGLKDFLYLPLFFLFLLLPSVWTALAFFTALLLSRLRRDNWLGIVTLLFFLMSVGLTGINTDPKGMVLIDKSQNRFLTLLTDIFPSLPLLYDVPLYGESFSQSVETGARPVLSDNSIFYVEGSPGEQLYLRNSVSRQPGGGGEIRPLQDFSSLIREQTDNLKAYRVDVMADFVNLIPYTEKTKYLELNESLYTILSPYWSLSPEKTLIRGDSFTLYERGEKFPETVRPGFDFEPYLTQNREPSPELLELAATVKGNTPRMTAQNIRQHLAAHYLYSLDTEEHENFTEDFLFRTGEGYCLHFASAFVALARANNIPCRFAEGYLVIFPEEEEEEEFGLGPELISVSVTGLSSHIWPEIYLVGEGWISFEATAPFFLPESTIATDRLTSRQLREIQKSGTEGEKKTLAPMSPLLYGMGPLMIFLIWGTIKLIDIMKRFGKNTLFIIRRVVYTAYTTAGVERPRNKGWIGWSEEVNREIPSTEALMKDILPLILKARYSPVALSAEENERLHKLYHEFRSRCQSSKKAIFNSSQ
jgi:hypothetical protein